MMGGLAFNYEDLRYIELQEPGSKFPARRWGGYSQDYDEADRVYTHEDVQIHPGDAWGVVGIDAVPHASVSLLVFDLDVHKAPDDFDPDDLSLPTNTAIVRSQSGGFHVYFMVHEPRGAGAESDFQMTESLGWDIDIRGSYVSHHVVAPGDVPAVGGDYELVNDETIAGVFDPADAAERIRYQGEPLLEIDRNSGVTDFEFDRPSDPPAEMPTCYHAGLELRKAAPEDHPNTHKVNVLTALCGLAAGYDPETVAEHFCGEWAPQDGDVDHSDVDTTEYQVNHLAEKLENGEYSPPALSTLRDYGILGDGEACECSLPYHGDGGTDQSEYTTVFPPAVRDLSTVTSGWDWRHTAEHGEDALTVEAARERTVDAIADAYTSGDRVLVEALPTMGKSYGAVQAAAETGERVTILTGRGHKEQYDQFKQWCDEHRLDAYTLPSFTRDCDTANGEHGEEWAEAVRDWYRRGATPKEIHKSAEYVLDRPLPCQEHDGQRCPYASKWDVDPDDYDVLIGHYAHAHKSKVTAGRTVVFDEFPDAYETQFGPQLQGAVSYWLEATDGVPFDSYTDLVEHREDQQRRAEALLWFEDHGVDLDETHVFDDLSAHAAAPLAVYTLLASDGLGNGFERAGFDDGGVGVFDRAAGSVCLLQPPALDYASGVVALDGTPTKRMWELALGERLNHRPVLQDGERAAYIREALNLNFVRTTEYVKPYNSADHVNTDRDAALLEAVAEAHGERPSLITTSTAEHEYDAEGVLEHVDETKHYGNVLGSNEFDDTRLGAVIGSNHYGDHYIKKWGAYAGEAVDRGEEKGADLSYSGFGDDVLQHMREHDTLQAAMRYGRDGNGAVVYVHTDTLPEWVPIAGEGRVLQTWSKGRLQVVEALADLGEATTADVVEHPAVDVGRRQVLNHLEALREEYDVLDRRQDPDDGRRVVWCDDGLHRLGEHGDVGLEPVDLDDLDDDEVDELARSVHYTWYFRNSPGDVDDTVGEPADDPVATDGGAVSTGVRPPDDPV
jgi:hypothetical protein